MNYHNFATRMAALLLLAIGLMKLLDSTVQNHYFQEPDSLFYFLNNRQLMIIAAAIEIGVAAYIWFASSIKNRGAALLWFCSIVAVYKVALLFTYNVKPCSCLGIFGKSLKLSNSQLEMTTWLILFVLASTAAIAWLDAKRKAIYADNR